MKKALIALLAAAIVFATGCSKEITESFDSLSDASETEAVAVMSTVATAKSVGIDVMAYSPKQSTKRFKSDNGTILLEYLVEYPVFSSESPFFTELNAHYASQEMKAKDTLDELYTSAKEYLGILEDTEPDMAENGSFPQASYHQKFEVTHNSGGIVCVCENEYIYYSGAAHGMSSRSSKLFDVNAKHELTPAQLLGISEAELKERVLAAFKAKISAATENDDEFYWSYDSAVKSYDNIDFCYKEDSLVFFYQLYDIAPYSSGFPEVVIPVE